MSLSWDDRAADVKDDPAVADELFAVGNRVAGRAAELAPKRTGAGARSIHAEVVGSRDDPEVRVSWDRAHFYMEFAELGTQHEPAEAFLRRAANEFR